MNDKRKHLPTLALFTLLLLLALRLTISESVLDSYFPPDPADQIRQPGPATTAAFTIVTLLAAAATALSHRLTRRHWLHLALIAAILTLAALSTFHAVNRFAALIGTCDLAIALIAGWSFSVLLANPTYRRLFFCVLIAISAAWLAKSAYQYLSEIPEAIDFYQKNKTEILAQHHWEPGDPSQILFESRMNSHEITGFSPFSNAFAAALLVPLLLAVAFLAMLVRRLTLGVGRENHVQHPTSNVQRKTKTTNDQRFTINDELLLVPFALLFLLTALTLYFTDSRGALSAALIALPVFLLGYLFSDFIYRHRRALTLALLAAAALTATATLAYGITHHALPTRSLLFRWQYWTGSLPIIQSHPLLGTGLNNFSSYYLQYKLPVAPEDVSDPHSFFIRLAAELGLPATLLTAALLLALILRPLLTTSSVLSPQSSVLNSRHFALGFLLIPLWFLLRFLIAEPFFAWMIYLTIFYALVAAAGFFLTASALRRLPASADRPLTYALLTAALAMFLYDQINVALITGPIAMLFWTLLAAAQPTTANGHLVLSPQEGGASVLIPPSSFSVHRSAFLIFLIPALALILLLPSLLNNTFLWNPAPLAQQAARALENGDPATALSLLQSARTRDPRSLQLLRWQVQAKLSLHQSTADDLRQILTLNPTNARTHLELAQLNSDLPAAERLTALQQALDLDTQLAPEEPKRLSASQRQEAATLIEQLRAATQSAP